MSKSTLGITVKTNKNYPADERTIEVPCRLPEAFNFQFKGVLFTALLSDMTAKATVSSVETEDEDGVCSDLSAQVDAVATSILATISATLGITGPVPPGSPLPAIALAYEAECAAYDACMNAHGDLPPVLHGDAMYWTDPSNGLGHAARMLAKYVEHVVEQASKVTP